MLEPSSSEDENETVTIAEVDNDTSSAISAISSLRSDGGGVGINSCGSVGRQLTPNINVNHPQNQLSTTTNYGINHRSISPCIEPNAQILSQQNTNYHHHAHDIRFQIRSISQFQSLFSIIMTCYIC